MSRGRLRSGVKAFPPAPLSGLSLLDMTALTLEERRGFSQSLLQHKFAIAF